MLVDPVCLGYVCRRILLNFFSILIEISGFFNLPATSSSPDVFDVVKQGNLLVQTLIIV